MTHPTRPPTPVFGIACHEIIAGLRPDQRRIEAADVHTALHSRKLRDALKGWDSTTRNDAADRLDRLVVYATLAQGRFERAELVDLLRQLGVAVDNANLDQSLERLTLGYVLGRSYDGVYRYQAPLFREFLLEDDIGQRLESEATVWANDS